MTYHFNYDWNGGDSQKKWLWQHTAINYINEGKTVDEAIEIANKKYGVNFDERLLT